MCIILRIAQPISAKYGEAVDVCPLCPRQWVHVPGRSGLPSLAIGVWGILYQGRQKPRLWLEDQPEERTRWRPNETLSWKRFSAG